MKGSLVQSLFAGLALLAMSAAIRAGLSDTRALLTFPLLVEKWGHYRDHRADYNVVVLGTSRLHAAFDPAAFEARVMREGVEVRAYNFGVPALNIREQREIIRRIVDLKPSSLTDVVLDVMPHQLNTMENITSARLRPLLTLDRLALSARDQWATFRAPPRRVLGILYLAGAYLHEHLAVGLWSQRWRGETEEAIYRMDLARQGFVPLDDETHPLITARHDDFLDNSARYAALSESLKREGVGRKPVPDDRYALLAETLALWKPLPVRITIVLHPRWEYGDEYRALADELPKRFPHVMVIPLCDPQADPDLVDPSLWYDRGHLNGEGAKVFSRRLAAEWVRADQSVLDDAQSVDSSGTVASR